MTDEDPKLEKLEEELKAARAEFDKDYNPPSKEDENISSGARAGIELVGAILGGGLIGYGLDYYFETSPAFFLGFLILGVITGFYNIYKITMNVGTSVGYKGLKSDSKEAKKSPNYGSEDSS
ncbi:MAG: AtpZ/AtpI family protein [Alphaproteobacteria bacterium]|nr:AtpZ/AtpI family protein [Alphaproteobacteria bacterium]